MTERDRILFADYRKRIENCFIDKGWIIVSHSDGVHCALCEDEILNSAMTTPRWDLLRDDGFPSYVSSFQKGEEVMWYERCGHSGIEQLIFIQWEKSGWPRHVHLSEEFVLLYDLRTDNSHQGETRYFEVDDYGDSQLVAIVYHRALEVKISLRHIRRYLAIRKLNLLIFFDIDRESEMSLSGLSIDYADNSITQGDTFIYSYSTPVDRIVGSANSLAMLVGKCVLKYCNQDRHFPHD